MKKRTVQTTSVEKIELSGDELVSILEECGYSIPGKTKCYITVPRGGDWSGEPLVIGEDVPLKIDTEQSTLVKEKWNENLGIWELDT